MTRCSVCDAEYDGPDLLCEKCAEEWEKTQPHPPEKKRPDITDLLIPREISVLADILRIAAQDTHEKAVGMTRSKSFTPAEQAIAQEKAETVESIKRKLIGA